MSTGEQSKVCIRKVTHYLYYCVGAAQLLGAMSFCAPRQLSACLPQIVPKLSEVLTDSHPKVVDAAGTALKQVGSVIRNPEIQKLVPVMMAAITDAANIQAALDALLTTSFEHAMDVASLALIVPTVTRALRDRSIDIKKKAAQIAGNMCALAGPSDLVPYLPVITPQLKAVLLDPIPEVWCSNMKIGSLMNRCEQQLQRHSVHLLVDLAKITSRTSSIG